MSVKIYFKNVGQGDTILLEWEDEAKKKKYGLIDCNLVGKSIRPITLHIEKRKITEFEFVVMSHPHTDHFSGFDALFSYCRENEIAINEFVYTSAFDPLNMADIIVNDIEQEFEAVVLASVTKDKHKDELRKLYFLLGEQSDLNSEGFIKKISTFSEVKTITLNKKKDIRLDFLAPGNQEIRQYIRKAFDAAKGNISFDSDMENNPDANCLSSLVRISFGDKGQVLLCSDLAAATLKRIREHKMYEDLSKRPLLVAQIPHHGSDLNHHENFWNDLNGINKTDFIFSVGNKYKHPGFDVVNYFHNCSGKVHATNFVGGFRQFFEKKIVSVKKRIMRSVQGTPGVYRKIDKENLDEADKPVCGEKKIQITLSNTNRISCKVAPVQE